MWKEGVELVPCEMARAVVRQAARLHHDAQRWMVVEHAHDHRSTQAKPRGDTCIGIGESEFEHALARSMAAVEMATLFGVACMTDSSRDPVSGSS